MTQSLPPIAPEARAASPKGTPPAHSSAGGDSFASLVDGAVGGAKPAGPAAGKAAAPTSPTAPDKGPWWLVSPGPGQGVPGITDADEGSSGSADEDVVAADLVVPVPWMTQTAVPVPVQADAAASAKPGSDLRAVAGQTASAQQGTVPSATDVIPAAAANAAASAQQQAESAADAALTATETLASEQAEPAPSSISLRKAKAATPEPLRAASPATGQTTAQLVDAAQAASAEATAAQDAAAQAKAMAEAAPAAPAAANAPVARDTAATEHGQVPQMTVAQQAIASASLSGQQQGSSMGESRSGSSEGERQAPAARATAQAVRAFTVAQAAEAAQAGTPAPVAASAVANTTGTTLSPEVGRGVNEQLVQSMRTQFRNGIGEAVVHLRPDHLGEVTINLKVENGVVSANIHAEMPAVRHWLESQEGTLRSGMAQQGLHLDRFMVTRDGQRQDAESQQQPPAPKRRATRGAESEQPRFEITV